MRDFHQLSVCPTCGTMVAPDILSDQEELSEVMVRLDVARAPAILFLQLWRAKGRIVTYTAFLDLQSSLTGKDGGHHQSVAQVKKHLWKKLKSYPVEIKSEYGVGYRLRFLNPEWDWRNEPLK